MSQRANRYSQIIEAIFFDYYHEGATEVHFERGDIVTVAERLGIQTPSNLGDIIYSFRYRTELPPNIVNRAPSGLEWIIRARGRALYSFVLVPVFSVTPSSMLVETKIPDATPGVINKYSLTDEQALLAKLRYNRMIDIFTGLTCYSLQSHLRTTVAGIGQVETDEIYVGLDSRGAHYVLPVQAKGGADRIGRVQIEQDLALCAGKYPELICRPIAAQFMNDEVIALFELEYTNDGIRVSSERHYRLVALEDLTSEELESYRHRAF